MLRARPDPAAGSSQPRYITRLDQVPQLKVPERAALAEVAGRYPFRVSAYYLGLINWRDPLDPLRRLIIPSVEELRDWGSLDPSNEAAVTVTQGVQHKYPHTVLLLCSGTCAGLCRYCFRKRLFLDGNQEPAYDCSAGLAYIAAHPEVTNVLLTGGDPLLLGTAALDELLSQLRAIPHVQIIRIGSKVPAFDPERITGDPELPNVLARHSTARRRIYLVAHFDHPRELTDASVAALDAVIRAGVICVNQCPLIRGINDDPAVLSELFRKLSWAGCPPYYVFQCRPTAGNRGYRVPIVRGWEVFRQALCRGSGLASRARMVMSHRTGKLEILAIDRRRIYLRYHRAQDARLRGQLVICRRDDAAGWLDDLKVLQGGLAADSGAWPAVMPA